MAGGQVSVASSKDAARNFSAPVQVTKEQLNLDWGPDARPKIVVDRKGDIVLAFSIFRDKAFNGQVLTRDPADGGKSFADAEADHLQQRKPALRGARPRRGWNGVRGMARQAQPRSGEGGGKEIRRSRAVLRVVEATAARPIPKRSSRPTIPASAAGSGWHSPAPGGRRRSSGTSSKAAFAITRSWRSPIWRRPAKSAASARRLADRRRARITGRASSISPQGPITSAWYTNGKARKGLFYARSRDEGRTFSAPFPIGRAAAIRHGPMCSPCAAERRWSGRSSMARRRGQYDDLARRRQDVVAAVGGGENDATRPITRCW